MSLRSLCALFVALPFFLSSPAFGWDESVHRAITRVAEEHISPAAAKRYTYYVSSGETLEDIAFWAQTVFDDRPETEYWHSITVPPNATGLDLDRDCPLGDCLPVKIREAEGIVRLAHKKRPVVGEYLRFLIHLMGDLHQPLNAGYPPSEGIGDPTVRYKGKEMSLSTFWDQHLFEGISVDELSEQIRQRITPGKIREWQYGTLRDWTWDSHLVAVRVAYGSLPSGNPRELDEDYIAAVQDAAVEQLAKAAVRMAHSLDQVWP